MIKGRPVIIKRVPPKVAQVVKPKVATRLSKIEERLLGQDRIQNLVNENSLIQKKQRKSIAPSEEKWSAQDLIKEIDCDFFQFKSLQETKDLLIKFHHMISNRKEFEYQNKERNKDEG